MIIYNVAIFLYSEWFFHCIKILTLNQGFGLRNIVRSPNVSHHEILGAMPTST